jgi:hypothetical protein
VLRGGGWERAGLAHSAARFGQLGLEPADLPVALRTLLSSACHQSLDLGLERLGDSALLAQPLLGGTRFLRRLLQLAMEALLFALEACKHGEHLWRDLDARTPPRAVRKLSRFF